MIDIFAPEGQPVLAATSGFVVLSGSHGAVGSTGNAVGKPAHLHYAIITPMPYPWRITTEPQGWRKMFFLDPGVELAD